MSACGSDGSEVYCVCNWSAGPRKRMAMLYCWIVVLRSKLTTGCVCDGFTNCTVPEFSTKRSPLMIASPPLRITRPRITGCAAVPFTCRLAEPLMLSVLLTRFTLLVECRARLRFTFWLKLAGGGGDDTPENWPRKLFRSNA